MHMHDADSSGLKGACGFPLHAFLVFSSALNWIQSERTDGTWTGRQTVDVAMDGRHLFKRLSKVQARISSKGNNTFALIGWTRKQALRLVASHRCGSSRSPKATSLLVRERRAGVCVRNGMLSDRVTTTGVQWSCGTVGVLRGRVPS